METGMYMKNLTVQCMPGTTLNPRVKKYLI